MFPDPLLFTFALLDTGVLLFLLVYFVSFFGLLTPDRPSKILIIQFYHISLTTNIRKQFIRQVIILSDVECDYLNAQQCCSKLNFWVIPKMMAHGFLTLAILVTGHYWLFLCNLPMLGWSAYELYTLPSGNMGVYDPTEIHNRGMIKKHLRDCMIYLGYFLISFFIYLYWYVCHCLLRLLFILNFLIYSKSDMFFPFRLINALLKGDPIRRHEDGEIITEL